MALCDYNMHRNSYPVLSHEMKYKAAHWHSDVARGSRRHTLDMQNTTPCVRWHCNAHHGRLRHWQRQALLIQWLRALQSSKVLDPP